MKSKEWNSLNDVVDEFRLPNAATDLEGIRNHLKSKLVEVHPDRSGGDFKSETEKESYLRLTQAIEFVESQHETTEALVAVPAKEINKLMKRLDDTLAPIRKAESVSFQSQFLNDYRNQVSARYAVSKFTSGIFAAVFMGILAFTEKLKENPVLAPLMRVAILPYAILTLLILCGGCFLLSWSRERDEKGQGEELTSDRGLLRAFSSFCSYPLLHQAKENNESALFFNRLEYADSLRVVHDGFSDIFQHFRYVVGLGKSEAAEPHNNALRIRRWHFQRLMENLKQGLKPMTISFPLSEHLARIHLERLLGRKVIRRAEAADLDERYEIDRTTAERIVRNRHAY